MSDAQTLDDIVVDEQVDANYSDVVNYNPLADNVEEKDYQKANLQGAGRLPDLEEPTFEPPTLEDIRPEMFGGDTGEDEDEVFGRERLNDMPKGDKKKAAQQMTEMILEGYSSICSFSGGFASMKENKLMEMQAEGRIDLRMPIPVSPTEQVGVLDFVQSYIAQIDEAMEVTDDFKEAVRPPMTRILEKKGVGMTDEQFLLVMFGKDIITKTATTIALKKQLTRHLGVGLRPIPNVRTTDAQYPASRNPATTRSNATTTKRRGGIRVEERAQGKKSQKWQKSKNRSTK